MLIREAWQSDLDKLVEYGEEFWNHTYFKQEVGMEYDADSVRDLCSNLIEDMNAGFVLVVTTDTGDVLGFGLVAYYPFVFNHNVKMSGELAFYLDESCRGHKIAPQLLEEMEEIAKEDGCRFITMISMTHSMDVGPLYKKLGYTKTEESWTKQL